MKQKKLSRDFYNRDTIDVALDLLGCTIVHVTKRGIVSGVITETEAYLGVHDPACHSYQERRTERVKSMYLDGGHAYVYMIYGIHFCFNVVTMNVNVPEAVLIRAVKPISGIELMMRRRHLAELRQLTNGPGKVCEAFGITKECDGLDLVKNQLFILARSDEFNLDNVESSGRIGVEYSGDVAHFPLRFRYVEKS